jgi:hypothetical protein
MQGRCDDVTSGDSSSGRAFARTHLDDPPTGLRVAVARISEATSGISFALPIPHIAEFIIGRAFARPVRPCELLATRCLFPIRRCKFERQPRRECGVTGRITPTGVVGGFVYRQGCRNPYSKIPVSVKGRFGWT